MYFHFLGFFTILNRRQINTLKRKWDNQLATSTNPMDANEIGSSPKKNDVSKPTIGITYIRMGIRLFKGEVVTFSIAF